MGWGSIFFEIGARELCDIVMGIFFAVDRGVLDVVCLCQEEFCSSARWMAEQRGAYGGSRVK